MMDITGMISAANQDTADSGLQLIILLVTLIWTIWQQYQHKYVKKKVQEIGVKADGASGSRKDEPVGGSPGHSS